MIRAGATGEGAVEIGRKLVIEFNNVPQTAMEAEYVSGRNIILKHDIAYPGFISELMQNKGDSPHIWIRNGIALTKEGEIIRSGIVTYDMELLI